MQGRPSVLREVADLAKTFAAERTDANVAARDLIVEVEEEEARAGQTGLGMRYVLIAGTALVIIGFAAVALGWFG